MLSTIISDNRLAPYFHHQNDLVFNKEEGMPVARIMAVIRPSEENFLTSLRHELLPNAATSILRRRGKAGYWYKYLTINPNRQLAGR